MIPSQQTVDWMKSAGLKVFAPATVSNVACGFDALGFALELPGDEVVVRKSDHKGLRITSITGDKGRLPRDPARNTAAISALGLLKSLNAEDIGLEMEIRKRMPYGSGLGSSGASAVAGVFAVNELLGRPLEREALLPFALNAEGVVSGAQHGDNVIPCLLGGFQLIRDHSSADAIRLPVPAGFHVTVVSPSIEVLTKESRQLLSETVPLSDAAKQAAHLGSFVAGMFRSDFDLISRSIRDFLIEKQRAHLIPYYSQLKESALSLGALGCNISGSGPSVFALCQHSLHAEQVGESFSRIYTDKAIDHCIYCSPINQTGAYLF